MMVDPLVVEDGRTITAARVMAEGLPVLLLQPDGLVHVQIGDCVAYLSVAQVMRELTDLMLFWREVREAWLRCE